MDPDPSQLAIEAAAIITDAIVLLSAGGASVRIPNPSVALRNLPDGLSADVTSYRATASTQRFADELVVIALAGAAMDASRVRRWFDQILDTSPTGVTWGHYKFVRTFPQRAPAGRGILAVFVERLATVPEDVFETWYNDTHVPELLATGYYQSAYRLKIVSGSLPTYLAIYETNAEPGWAADALTEMRDRWSFPIGYGDPTEVKLRGAFVSHHSKG